MKLEEAVEVSKGLGLDTYDHAFGTASTEHCKGVLPRLVDVAALAIRLCKYDGRIDLGGGVRSEAQARDNAARGTGIVNSLHRLQPDGYGHALDLIALTPDKGVDWKNKAAFQAMAIAVGHASAILSIPIRQGCDWDQDGVLGEPKEYDWPHFEHPKPQHLARAVELMQRRRQELGLENGPNVDPAEPSAPCPHCGKPVKVTA